MKMDAIRIENLSKKYKDVLANYELYATGTTGTLIMGETALPIHRMKSGPLGGGRQVRYQLRSRPCARCVGGDYITSNILG